MIHERLETEVNAEVGWDWLVKGDFYEVYLKASHGRSKAVKFSLAGNTEAIAAAPEKEGAVCSL